MKAFSDACGGGTAYGNQKTDDATTDIEVISKKEQHLTRWGYIVSIAKFVHPAQYFLLSLVALGCSVVTSVGSSIFHCLEFLNTNYCILPNNNWASGSSTIFP